MTYQSIINGQLVRIEQLVTPLGVGVAANTDPSLSPDFYGALAVDGAEPNTLYIADGTQWTNVAQSTGLIVATSATINGITLTSSGQPNLTGNLYIQMFDVEALNMVYFEFYLNHPITVTANSTWTASAVVPISYRPTGSRYFTSPILVSDILTSTNAFLSIDSSGDLSISIATTGNITVTNICGNYFLL